ncbi:hypothetical protein [Phenylobacterium sp.]|uniref:hypothetical protein n=1 Tax=Phenylobacterium sp. TaxID=1871053 RepID=UPI002FE2D159
MAKPKQHPALDRFFADVEFEVGEAISGVGPEIAQVRSKAVQTGNLSSSRLGIAFAQTIDTHATAFIEKTKLRYEAARATPGASPQALHTIWVQGLQRYVGHAREIARVSSDTHQDGSREAVLDSVLDGLVQHQMARINHAVRGFEGRPPKPWHERHPFWREVVVATVGAVVGSAITVAAQLMG